MKDAFSNHDAGVPLQDLTILMLTLDDSIIFIIVLFLNDHPLWIIDSIGFLL